MAAKKDLILLDIQGEIAVITFNIPHKLNALSGDLYRQLAFLLREVAAMDQITITVLTGNGRFFSAGADVASIDGKTESSEGSPRTFWLRNFAANNLELTKAFISHPKLLVAALNGPAVGLSAAIIAHCDFIYATSSTFILTPFTSLGLVAEGGSSFTFVRRLGLSKANEALILSKPIHAEELLACGFLNRIYPTPENPNDTTGFHKQVLGDIKKEFLDRGLNRESMLGVKQLVKASWNAPLEDANVKEVFDGLERFLIGAPQKEFAAIKSGAKKHKL